MWIPVFVNEELALSGSAKDVLTCCTAPVIKELCSPSLPFTDSVYFLGFGVFFFVCVWSCFPESFGSQHYQVINTRITMLHYFYLWGLWWEHFHGGAIRRCYRHPSAPVPLRTSTHSLPTISLSHPH